MGNISREIETEKESEGHSRNYKHCNKLKNVLEVLISGPELVKERISELKESSTETL